MRRSITAKTIRCSRKLFINVYNVESISFSRKNCPILSFAAFKTIRSEKNSTLRETDSH